MVGVLLFRNPDFQTDKEIESVESLFNHVDDTILIEDIKAQLHYTNEEISEVMTKIPTKYSRFDNLWKKLTDLRKHFKLGVINNGTALTLNSFKTQFEFEKYFDIFVNSAEEGVKKPDARIFLLACKKLDVRPEDCIFIDDSYKNVLTANSLGMQGIWWDKRIDKETHLSNLLKFIIKQ